MKLRKHQWTSTKLTDICTIANGATPRGIESLDGKGDIPFFRVNDMNLEGNEIHMNSWTTSLDALESKNLRMKLYPEGTVIFPKRGASIHTNKKRILSRHSAFDLNTMGLVPSDRITPYFLFTWMQSLNLSLIADGSYIPQINNKNISVLSLNLPPIEEQKHIAEMFQSIDIASSELRRQERNLRSITKRLANELASHNPSFGSVLEGKTATRFRFDEIANCIEHHERNPLSKGLTRFVGLEHIEPENLEISDWGNIEDGTTFTKSFEKRDVLFGKRRAYLRKVAVADFDGICSSDILVFRANENRIIADLLPFYVRSDAFIQTAIDTSAGSLSPRTKWKDLAKFEVMLPPFESQERILVFLRRAETSVNDAVKQQSNLADLKKRLINEVFGN